MNKVIDVEPAAPATKYIQIERIRRFKLGMLFDIILRGSGLLTFLFLANPVGADLPGATLTRLYSFGELNDAGRPGSVIEGGNGVLYGTTHSGGVGYGTVFCVNKDGSEFTVLKTFDYFSDGAWPGADLIEGSDGVLYGTTASHPSGGGVGTVFRVNKDGSDFAVLTTLPTSGLPPGRLTEASDGALYGTSNNGVFRLNKDGSGFAVLKTLSRSESGGLIEGSDGALYGTTGYTGPSSKGTVFRLNKDGTGFVVLKNFDTISDGENPRGGLLEGVDGALYGTTFQGGAFGYGAIFRLNKDGSGFTVLKSLDGVADGRYPLAGVSEGGDGALYGTAYQGGDSGYGAIFRLNKDGTGFSVLRSLDGGADGRSPFRVTEGSDGALYGTAALGGAADSGTIFRLNKEGSGFTVLKSLMAAGRYPSAGVTEGSDGALYGTARGGGASQGGTIFRLNKDGSDFAVIKSFDFLPDGFSLHGGVIEGSDGALYGTAYQGGQHFDGTVFRLNKDGTGFSVIKAFSGFFDGCRYPRSGVIEGKDGMLYGTTEEGGIFRIHKNGTGFALIKHLFSFLTAGVTEGNDGVLYGVDAGGGLGYGTVFRLNKDGSDFAVLKSLNGGTDGSYPHGGVIEGNDGALYGTASEGGDFGYGTVFRLNKDGSGFAVLKSLNGGTDGSYPDGGVTEGNDGALYGTAWEGGASGYGTVFRLNKDGSEFEVLQALGISAGGPRTPTGRLTYASNGRVYGTSVEGGDANFGTVFALSIPVANPAPMLTSLTPATAYANGGAFDLTVVGTGFLTDAVVHWKGAPRSTTLLSSSQLMAAIPASDLETGVDIAVATVQVVNGDGQVSNPLGFSIVAQTVGTVDGAVSEPGETTTVSTAPTTEGEPGVTVTVENNGEEPITVLAASYDERPVGETVFQVDNGSFVDVQIVGADENVSATVLFYYPSTVTGGMENRVKLRYFDGTDWIPVLSSGGLPPAKDITDDLDNTISGGRFTVVFDMTSTPTIIELSGTVFGMFESQPQLQAITGPEAPVALGNEITVSVEFVALGDPNAVEVYFLWGDGTESVVVPTVVGNAAAAHLYAAPGVYGVTVRVVDGQDDVREGRFEYVVIYDPNGGFVTGGGWIQSPPGAYMFDPTLAGKATFGFNSRYQKGKQVPTGDTQFQFQAAEFRFHSTAYEWLVVSGAKAQYKGVGKVNNAGDYGFLLTATDGQVKGGGGIDKFRIKIWEWASGIVVYDNVQDAADDLDGANPQDIGGGRIVIHQSK
jgi:uncharacterized repeat protein (TIGR03803 family)